MRASARSVYLVTLGLLFLATVGPVRGAGDPFETLGVQMIPEPAPSPALSLPDLAGRVVAIPDEFRGKVVLLGFFTST